MVMDRVREAAKSISINGLMAYAELRELVFRFILLSNTV
jgi:hypothetical protein